LAKELNTSLTDLNQMDYHEVVWYYKEYEKIEKKKRENGT
jgi:hypothetical protein